MNEPLPTDLPPASPPYSSPAELPTAAPGPQSSAGTVIAWTVIILAVALLLLGRVVRERADDDAGAKKPADGAAELSTRIMGRYALGAKLLMQSLPGGDPAQVEQMAEQVERAATTPLTRVRVVPVVAELRGADRALALLGQTDPHELELRDDVADLRTTYTDGPDALSEEARQRLVERHDWFGKLAVSWGKPDTEPMRREVLAAAKRTAVVALVAMIGGLVVGLAALALFVTAIVLLAVGKIRRRYEPPLPRGSRAGVFVEAFALYLAWFIGVSLVAGALGAREGNMKWFWAILAGSAPLACLWPLARGVRFDELRRGLGWHRGRGWFTEIAAGAGGYVAGIPVIIFGIALTTWLSRAMDAQPTHPIVEDISTRLRDVLALLLLAAVYAPLAEETMFRGALYHGTRRRLPFIASALLVAFIFAVIHPQGIAAVPALMGIALVLAALREWRGSIVAPVVAHAINNGVILILLVLTVG